MAKQRRAAAGKSAARKTSKKAAPTRSKATARKGPKKKATARKATSRKAAKTGTTRKTGARKATKKAGVKRSTARGRRKPAAAPVANIRKAYAKAVALYEKGVKAMQRKQFRAAATALRQLLEDYPEERELHDRAKLYLNVCERQVAPDEKTPRGVEARLFAATVALNRGDLDEALSLLRGAAASHPDDDRIQYMLALTHAQLADAEASATHLEKAISINPDNRRQARQEPDFDPVREAAPVRVLLAAGR